MTAPAVLWQNGKISRGFTAHEQLDQVGLVHMNGRVYDPELGRFLSADPFVADISNLQGLNRYSYVENNPLSFTDPSGYFLSGLFKAIGKAFGAIFRAVAHAVKAVLSSSIIRSLIQIAICISTAAPTGGLGCAAASAGLTLASGGTPLQALKAFAFSLVSQAVWTNVGAFLKAEGLAGNILAKGLVHGVVGGAVSVAQGGNFFQGFVSSAVSAGTGLVSSQISGDNIFLDTAIVATAGGVAAQLTGGKFANGAITAAFANLYNKFQHKGTNYVNPLDIGNDAHQTLQDDRLREVENTFAEQWTDNNGTTFLGRPDLGNRVSHELWEIKPDHAFGIARGLSDLAWYISTSIGGSTYSAGGMSILPEGGPITLHGQFASYTYRLAAPGVIAYTYDPYPTTQSLGFVPYWGAFYGFGPGAGMAPVPGGRGRGLAR